MRPATTALVRKRVIGAGSVTGKKAATRRRRPSKAGLAGMSGRNEEDSAMRNGVRIVDIDTHVNPSYETLVKYLDPDARSRVAELQPFVRTRNSNGTTSRVLHVAPYPFDRFPGEAPTEAKVVAGGKGALE